MKTATLEKIDRLVRKAAEVYYPDFEKYDIGSFDELYYNDKAFIQVSVRDHRYMYDTAKGKFGLNTALKNGRKLREEVRKYNQAIKKWQRYYAPRHATVSELESYYSLSDIKIDMQLIIRHRPIESSAPNNDVLDYREKRL